MRIDPEFAAAVASVVGGYHVFLRARVRANPNYTIQALLDRARAAWVLRMMEEREGILAVQSMRNVIMGATFFATTAVALIVGTIPLFVSSCVLVVMLYALDRAPEEDGQGAIFG